jgi:DNA-binding MarR family transcriptional regulator
MNERLTAKQFQILDVLTRGNPDGSFCDMDELISRVGYETSKDSMHFSVRALIKRGFVVKHERESRRGKSRRVLSATPAGYDLIRTSRSFEE